VKLENPRIKKMGNKNKEIRNSPKENKHFGGLEIFGCRGFEEKGE